MILKQRHTGIVVRQLDRSINFYKALGLTLWRRELETGAFISTVVGLPGTHLEWAKLTCPDGSLVELLQYHSHPSGQTPEKTPANSLGCSHLAFTVADSEATCDTIRKLGGTVVNPPALSPDNSVRVAYCHDPDGTLLEIVEELGSHD
jgi:catechol 2,3-dioxygenase-like lactoylglutathione lyase family enzyme